MPRDLLNIDYDVKILTFSVLRKGVRCFSVTSYFSVFSGVPTEMGMIFQDSVPLFTWRDGVYTIVKPRIIWWKMFYGDKSVLKHPCFRRDSNPQPRLLLD
jgi:hypothetical protein